MKLKDTGTHLNYVTLVINIKTACKLELEFQFVLLILIVTKLIENNFRSWTGEHTNRVKLTFNGD